MYKSTKFWIFATICFVIFTILYAINNGILSFVAIMNGVMLLICVINLIVVSRKNNINKNKSKKNKE